MATRLVDELTRAISGGALAPGQRLVEAELQQRHAAGRSSVREALRQLHARGLVTLEANRGASVRKLSRGEVTDLFVIRERLEGLGALLAAQRVAAGAAPTATQRSLRSLVVRMGAVAARGDAAAYPPLNRELHRRLLALSGNVELLRLVNELQLPIFHRQFQGFLNPLNQRRSHAEHVGIVDAVLAGDARAAERRMQRHVRSGLRLVLQWPDESFAAPGRPAAPRTARAPA